MAFLGSYFSTFSKEQIQFSNKYAIKYFVSCINI